MKQLIKDKRGMTLTEIVVALTLLMLVIVGTTPVLLSSYDSLYSAGEYTQDTYEAKSEIEDILATRNSLNVIENFKVNFETIGEVAQINGKRAVSSLYNSLETIFTGGRAHVAIISSKVINDDKITQTVVLQTTNVGFTTSDQVIANNAHLNTITPQGNKKVDITAMLPDKTTDVLSNVYNPGKYRASVQVVSANPETGRIIITISGADFTTSPVKIMVTYLDENNKVKTTSCYLTIKTPTIMMAGTTNFGKKYYTTAGVETLTYEGDGDDDATNDPMAVGTKYTKLQVDGRTMRIEGSSSTQEVPAGTVFKSVNWVTEYVAGTSTGNNEGVEFPDTSYEPSYYVLTGTNGAIYRTYTFTGVNDVVGKVDLNTTDAPYSTGQLGEDVIGLTERAYILDDAQSTTVYPATWGGDFSHIFGYSSYSDKVAYTGTNTWYTQSAQNSGIGQPGYYSNKANFGYYFDGFGANFSYLTQRSKKVSYILTEANYALRVGGFLGELGDFDTPLNRAWERPITWKTDGSYEGQKQEEFKGGWNVIHAAYHGYYYFKKDDSVKRVAFAEIDANDDRYSKKDEAKYLPVYFANNGSGNNNRRNDDGFAQLRIKHLSTISPTFFYDRWNDQGGEEGESKDTESGVKFVFNNTTNQSKVNVTDAVYLPATSKTSGGVFYVGSVAAYSLLNQLDNVGGDNKNAEQIYNNGNDNKGAVSSYFIQGNAQGTSTTIYKRSNSVKGTIDTHGYFQSVQPKDEVGIKANEQASHDFFVNRPTTETDYCVFNDVLFTMGFASNREMVYSKIVYGLNSSNAVQESYKTYEPYYFLSHYDDENHVPNLYLVGQTNTYLNKSDNDYYNVWFPGEMYNLTKVATRDGITVAVGYAVSGSTYTYINETHHNNASTALGGIYNDGVLAAMVLGKDASFTNLLYFKDIENFDSDSLGSKAGYSSVFTGGYGTHQRDSVQFTAVDISVQHTTSGSVELASYYAYYADNKGRLFRSLVANKTTYSGASSLPTLVSHIADEAYDGTRTAPSYMEEIKFTDGSEFSDYFDKITTIKCSGDYIIVSGYSTSANSNNKWHVAVGIVQDDGSVVFKKVSLDAANAYVYSVEDALILDGYVYFVGVNISNNKGWIYAHSLEDIASKAHNGVIIFNGNHFVGDENLQDRLYAIDGHSAS